MCEKDLILWRLRSLAYSTTATSSLSEKSEIKKMEKKEREVDAFNTFFTSPKKDTEQANRTTNSQRFLQTESKNVLSERIPFDFIPRISLNLKEDFAFGIRPSDDGAIKPHSSQLGSVHLHTELKIK